MFPVGLRIPGLDAANLACIVQTQAQTRGQALAAANSLPLLPPPPIGPIPNPPHDATRGGQEGEKVQTVTLLVGATTTGATIGTAVLGPGVGTAVGAAGGAIAGLVGSWFLAKSNESSRRKY